MNWVCRSGKKLIRPWYIYYGMLQYINPCHMMFDSQGFVTFSHGELSIFAHVDLKKKLMFEPYNMVSREDNSLSFIP